MLAAVIAALTVSPMTMPVQKPDSGCIVMEFDLDERISPLDSVTLSFEEGALKVCYGRPSSRGRTMIGGRQVPYGELWRTGANEPTMIHATTAISLAGIAVKPGTYSLYTIPEEDRWTVIVNRSITQWGHIAAYTYRVRRAEVGRVELVPDRLGKHVETLTLHADPRGALVLEWEHTRLRIPVQAARP
jgi:hypothetical protein